LIRSTRTCGNRDGPDDDEFEPEVEPTGQKVFRRTLRIHVK
jgi:hypothetical protein